MSAITQLQLWCLAAATGTGSYSPRSRAVAPHDPSRIESPSRRRDLGQATTEYALVLLGASAIALLVITWATAGGGAGRIGRLFDRVIDAVISKL